MYLLLCRSLTYAQRSQRILERKGITAVITKAPREAAANGCSYCLRIQERKKEAAMQVLQSAGLAPERLFFQQDGSIREVL